MKKTSRLSAVLGMVCLSSLALSPVWSESDPQPLPAQPPVEAQPAVQNGRIIAKPVEAVSKVPKQNRKALKGLKELTSTESMQPVLDEIEKLKWQAAPLQNASGDTQKITLENVLQETSKHNLSVRQAEAQIKDAEAQAKAMTDNFFNLLNPPLAASLKQAGNSQIQAAKAHLQAVRQKALLESSRMYSGLTQAYLGKYLAFQAIEQGKSQLKLERQRFENGETTSFDVTQTELVLIDRYSRYLSADNAYHAASVSLTSQMGHDSDAALVPEEVALRQETGMVPALRLIPDDLTAQKAVKASQTRPDAQEVQFRKDALKHLIKASMGQEKQKREAELRLLEFETEKAQEVLSVLVEKAFADYKLAQKQMQLARESHELGVQFVHQLQVSYEAGFSSTKDLLDGQVELAKAKSSLISAQLQYNLSQIQLAYEMGLLQDDLVSHPLPPNTL